MSKGRESGAAALVVSATLCGSCNPGEEPNIFSNESSVEFFALNADSYSKDVKTTNRNLSTVTLIFHGVSTEGVEVFHDRTLEPVPFSLADSDGLLAVTVLLKPDERYKLVFRFLGAEEKVFRASLFPTHAFEAYPGLKAQTSSHGSVVPLVSLNDHGTDHFQLREGQALTVPSNDLVTLWNGTRLAVATRVRIANHGKEGRFSLVSSSVPCKTLVERDGSLMSADFFPLEENSTLDVVVFPSDCVPIEISLRREPIAD